MKITLLSLAIGFSVMGLMLLGFRVYDQIVLHHRMALYNTLGAIGITFTAWALGRLVLLFWRKT